jgi:hypothetical protein
MTTFVFSTQFYPDEKNARPALNIGYFLVILVGNGMFYYYPHFCTFIFIIWVPKVHGFHIFEIFKRGPRALFYYIMLSLQSGG